MWLPETHGMLILNVMGQFFFSGKLGGGGDGGGGGVGAEQHHLGTCNPKKYLNYSEWLGNRKGHTGLLTE